MARRRVWTAWMIALIAFLTLLGSARALHNTPAPTPAPSSTDHHHDDDHHVEIAPDDVYPDPGARYRHGAPTAEWIPASYQMGEEDFALAFQASANGIVRVDVWGYLRVYYRRVVDKETFTPYYYLFNNWNPHRNEYGVDYELYSTYTAALNRDDSDDSTPTCNDVKEAFANEPGSFPGKGFPYGCEFMEGDFGFMYKSTGSQVGFDGARALERDPESCSRVMNGTFACDTASAAKHGFSFPHGWRVYLESPQPLSERWHPPPDVQFVTLGPDAGVEGEGDLDVAGEVDQFTIRTRARVVEAGKVFALYRTAGTGGTPDPSDPFLVLKARTVDAKTVFELFVDTGVDGCEVTLVTNASWTEPESVDLAVTYDDGAAAVYVDGSLDAMGSMPAECVSPTTKPTQWRLGDAGSGMAGDVNFLTVWSRTALAPWRVRRAALADYSHVPPPDHHFNFDEPPGTTEVTNSIDNGRRSSASLDPGCEIVGIHDGSLAQLDTSLAVLDADVHVHVPWTSKLAKVFQGSFSMQMWVKPGGDVEEDVELNIFGNYDVSNPEFGDCSCACDGKPVANGTINVTDDQGAMGVTSRQCAAAGPEECGDMVTDGVIDACPGGVDFTAVWSYVPTYTGANFTDDHDNSTSTYHGDCECLCETAVVGDGGCSGEGGVPEWCHINVTGDISGKGIPEDACSVHGPGVCDTYANYFLAANISHLFPQCNGTNFTTKWSYNSTYTGAVWSDDEDSTDSGSGGGAECRCYCGSEKTQAQYAGYVNGITSEQCIQDGPTSTTFGCPGSETHFSQTCDTYYVEYVANPGGTTGRKLMQDSGPDGESYQGYSGPTGRHLLTASSGTGTRSTCGKIGNSYVSITDADVAAGSMNSENRVIMTEWRGAGYCDDDVAPLWTFMDATSTLTESDMYERDVLGAARVAAPAAEARCYRDGGDSIRLTCLPDGVLSVLSFFCADGCGADDAANEVRTGEHLLVNVTSERGEVCDAAAGAAPRIVSSCGGLAVAQSFSGALATAAGPFGSFRGYRAPMESLRETHPLWVGARGPGAKNVTAAKAENEMLASLGYETTPALNHLCLDSTDREAMGWTKHSPSTNDGYISIATDDPKSWCAGHDYVSLECPRNDDTLHVWCANADQLDGAARKPSGECRGEPSNYHCPGLPRPERFVWNGIDLGGAYRASLYKQGYFAELIPTPCDASGPVANGGLGGCADPLPHGESCEPTCNSGSSLSGRRTCHDGRLIDTAKCVKSCDASGSIANGVAGECGGVLAHGA